MVTVSIVIPIHNEEKTIGLCISSIKNMELPPNIRIEIIAVLDRCTDNSERILSKFSDVKIVKKNSVRWRNKYSEVIAVGMKHATGDYLGVIDADIVVTKNWLVEILKSFENSKIVSASGHLKIPPNSSINRLMREFKTPIGGNRIYTAEIWKETKGYQNVSLCSADTHLDLRIMEKGYEIEMNHNAIAYDLREYTLKKIWKTAIQKGVARFQLNQSFKFIIARGLYKLLTDPFGILVFLGNINGFIKAKVQKLEKYNLKNKMKKYEKRRFQRKF